MPEFTASHPVFNWEAMNAKETGHNHSASMGLTYFILFMIELKSENHNKNIIEGRQTLFVP